MSIFGLLKLVPHIVATLEAYGIHVSASNVIATIRKVHDDIGANADALKIFDDVVSILMGPVPALPVSNVKTGYGATVQVEKC